MTIYRNRLYATFIAFIAVLFLVAGVAAAAFREGDLLERGLPLAPVALLSAFCLLRLARAGVYADERGIRIVNPLRTVTVPWEHVTRFRLGASGGFPTIAFADLVDGERIQIWGIQARSRSVPARRVPEELVDALNERLAEARRARR